LPRFAGVVHNKLSGVWVRSPTYEGPRCPTVPPRIHRPRVAERGRCGCETPGAGKGRVVLMLHGPSGLLMLHGPSGVLMLHGPSGLLMLRG